MIGISGDTGSPGAPHLHFEVRKNVNGTYIPVDPYGWMGSGPDPYPLATNINLWAQPLRLHLNGTDFHAGGTLILTAASTAPATPTVVDAYVALRLPDGSLLFLQGNGSFTRAVWPIVTNWTVAPFDGEIFRYTFGGREPQGHYAWLAAFTVPGTMHFIGDIVEVPFMFSP